MPRLPPSLFHRAHALHPLLPLLLPTSRTLSHATAELSWLTTSTPPHLHLHLCRQRGRGHPLQYLLGTQPFQNLTISCTPGVLIPRAETEEIASHLSHLLTTHTPPKTTPTLDLFTGSGCLALSLAPSCRKALGIDLSPTAITLARRNLSRNATTLGTVDVRFSVGDVTDVDTIVALAEVHDVAGGLVVANPPYVSCDEFDRETERSVRIFEPRDALVPPGGDGDWFYPKIVEVAERVGARGLVVEVGGWGQAERVKERLVERGGDKWRGVAVWRDFAGVGRAVVAWRWGWEWLREGPNEKWSQG